MFPQHLSGEISTPTDTADVISLSRVNLNVILVLSALPPGELLATVLTLIDHILLLGVHHLDVSAEGSVGAEVVGALRAAEGFLPGVDGHVIGEAGAVGECSGAEFALELLKVRLVTPLVNVQTGGRGIILATDLAVELLLAVGRPLVSVQALLLLCDELALGALVQHRPGQVLLLDVSRELLGLPVEEAADSADEL